MKAKFKTSVSTLEYVDRCLTPKEVKEKFKTAQKDNSTRYTLRPATYTKPVRGKGRGVFATRNLKAGELVLVNDVAEIEPRALKETSSFNDYPMAWTKTHDAIAFGSINLLNHSEVPNCRIKRYIKKRVMECYTIKAVKKDEELVIQYACPLWFDVK